MNFKTINPPYSILRFIKNILVFERARRKSKTVLPFFADDYLGLILNF